MHDAAQRLEQLADGSMPRAGPVDISRLLRLTLMIAFGVNWRIMVHSKSSGCCQLPGQPWDLAHPDEPRNSSQCLCCSVVKPSPAKVSESLGSQSRGFGHRAAATSSALSRSPKAAAHLQGSREIVAGWCSLVPCHIHNRRRVQRRCRGVNLFFTEHLLPMHDIIELFGGPRV